MPKVTQYVQVIGSAVVSVFTAYENLSPAAKTFIDNELTAIKTEFATVKTSLDNFASASTVGKVSAGFDVLSVLGSIVSFAEQTYQNGEQLFASDWAAIKGPVDSVIALFSGAPATASTATTPAVAASDPAAPAAGA